MLRGKAIWLPNQVWAIDTTYIRLHHGFLYLTAVIDWYSRRIVGWDLSESLVTSGPIRAIENAMNDAGVPAIINSDQGSQFKSYVFQRFLREHHIRQSMCDKARYVDNIMIERWFRSFKTELIYVQNFDSPKDARRQIRNYIDVYTTPLSYFWLVIPFSVETSLIGRPSFPISKPLFAHTSRIFPDDS